MKKGGWRKKKEIYRKVVADINREFPRFTKNWRKLHPKFFKGNWKA